MAKFPSKRKPNSRPNSSNPLSDVTKKKRKHADMNVGKHQSTVQSRWKRKKTDAEENDFETVPVTAIQDLTSTPEEEVEHLDIELQHASEESSNEADPDDDDDEQQVLQQHVREANRKHKKSGGFQAMGKQSLALSSQPDVYAILFIRVDTQP